MRFTPTDEQRAFTGALDALLAGADAPGAARAWSEGDTAPGLALWRRLAEQGVHALAVPEESGGLGAGPVDLVLALEVVGRHALPGPWVESVAFLPALLGPGKELAALAEGAVGTAAAPPLAPRAVDADVADQVWVLADEGVRRARPGSAHRSVDAARRLVDVTGEGEPTPVPDAGRALDLAVLASAAQLLGLGERLLDDTVAYVKQRRQFGREIGSYQALKHRLADVRITLDFAAPLVHGAAVTFDSGPAAGDRPEDRGRAVSAARIAAGDAAYLATRAALQLHGAIGYTRELDLSLPLLKVRALVSAWGTPSLHRRRVLDRLTGTGA